MFSQSGYVLSEGPYAEGKAAALVLGHASGDTEVIQQVHHRNPSTYYTFTNNPLSSVLETLRRIQRPQIRTRARTETISRFQGLEHLSLISLVLVLAPFDFNDPRLDV